MPSMNIPSRTSRICGFLILLSLILCNGCHSTRRPGDARFAAVDIHNRSADDIREATVSVFREKGYDVITASGDHMVFEKKGTRSDLVAYGGWFDSEVWVRVRASIVRESQDLSRLECEAFMVRSKGDWAIEEEQRISVFRNGPYHELLQEAARRAGGQ